MAHVNILDEDLALDSPMLIEGLPGVGLVGKIAADHVASEFEMTHYANVHCEGIPRVAVYADGDPGLHTPVRLYADEERDLLVLRSDVPISPAAATEFANCVADWFDENDVTPIYISGIPREQPAEVPSLYGVSTGEGDELLSDAGIDTPMEAGLVSGPTGALLNFSVENDRTSVGLVVESDPQFPDPQAARTIIKDGIEPLAGVDVPTEKLVDRAEDIREARERLVQRLQEASEESTQAQPLRMYQ
ncbi:proteasome assembly chaperone family protein [Halegenticoccus tardaugens]|uniref:proteasome assembly chaperone family protein n=1 Tax=Halegenticoccus tardaugens TaxID=2071624 RepID=UPI00100B922B|nr:PAC2 family protein [Halegenticoccus tardaugens]